MGDFSCQSNHQSISLLLSCLLHISWTLWVIIIELPSNNPLNKIVCVLPLIQLPSLKVIVLGHRIYPWILFLLHISWTFRIILIRLHSNIPLIKIVCRTHDLADIHKVKVILQGLGIYPSIWCWLIISPLNDFHKTSFKCSPQCMNQLPILEVTLQGQKILLAEF